MENRTSNYIASIEHFIKEGNIKEAMDTVAALSSHSYQLGVSDVMEAKENINDEDRMPDNDMVNSPSHYQSYVKGLNIECIDAMRAAFGDEEVKSFCKLNAFKYLFRCGSKGQDTDIAKAQWYLNKFKEPGGFE